jgi:hypothetical protein
MKNKSDLYELNSTIRLPAPPPKVHAKALNDN